ncbi:LacI family DNA-binding transcriptional regulator [Clostridium thermosuccinogenes]|uniref:LacI family DNA-binding transcriptional regulator n=1 Tax=Clostridium thermosuccinogenes TaxID=84032 RepID=UPI000CCC987F|nr:LacI family DNA-binding transcriptional regulator [Pseudoclostridium thermosuccinogenes]PNT92745.1 LacI family transcriptional regulator [Pseudoclostridium thermosuccinogenes]
MTNIQDVAKVAGVSVATVSRVLNNSSSVSARTRENVLKAIKELNYQPNLLGRNLRRMEARMILVLLPNISNPFYSRVVKGIEDVARKNDYFIMLCNTDSDASQEKLYLKLLKNRLSDGVIFLAPELKKEELSEIGINYPTVQCCEYKEGARVSHVTIDNYAAGYNAVKHLIDLGHKRIGLISCRNNFVSTKQREAGYRKALEDSGIDFDSRLITYGDYSFMSGMRCARQLLDLEGGVTAIFAISDVMAIGAMRAVKEKNMSVPKDIAVVGFDNISFASMSDPMLTTISQPKYEIGCTAMNLLLEQIKGSIKESRHIVLEHELIVRESTVGHSMNN